MSGFAYNLKYTTAMTPVAYCTDDEAAGKVGKILGVIAAVVVPFAAPAIWGAITASGAIAAGLGGAMTTAFGATAAGIIGSAATGALLSAGTAYLSGARGGDVWRAAGIGAVGAGLSAGFGALRAGATATNAGSTLAQGSGAVTQSGMASTFGGGGGVGIGGAIRATGMATTASTGASPGILSSLGQMFSNNPQLVSRLGSAIVNAAVNGGSVEGMDDLVAQQRAELQALQAQDQAAYAQRVAAAQNVLAAADRMDPNWLARVRMADVMGTMNREHDQAKRNIATKQGGSLDAGQAKAYERSGRLAIGRAKANAYNDGWASGVQGQAQLYGQAAGLFTGPNMDPWRMDTELLLGQHRARQQANRSTAAGFASVFGERTYAQPTSPEQPGNNEDDEDQNNGGLTNPFGWG